jgi:hypothetical protein
MIIDRDEVEKWVMRGTLTVAFTALTAVATFSYATDAPMADTATSCDSATVSCSYRGRTRRL